MFINFITFPDEHCEPSACALRTCIYYKPYVWVPAYPFIVIWHNNFPIQ